MIRRQNYVVRQLVVEVFFPPWSLTQPYRVLVEQFEKKPYFKVPSNVLRLQYRKDDSQLFPTSFEETNYPKIIFCCPE